MKLTTYTDFGIRTLMYLATLPDGDKSSSAEVAQVYQASRNHIAKVIAHLSALGYIDSSRGKNGGIWLIQTPENINIGMLIRQLENTLSPATKPPYSEDSVLATKNSSESCKLKTALNAATNAFLTAMDQFRLSDLLENETTLNELWRINTAVLSTTDTL